MTIKEIASFTARDEKTVRRWIKKAGTKCPVLLDKMSIANHGKPVDFNIAEVERILKASSISKEVISILMENAKSSNAPTLKTSSNLSAVDVEMISKIVAVAVESAITKLNINQTVQPALPKIEAPKKDARAHITELVRKYAEKTNAAFRDVYTMLYTEYGYRTHSNPSKCVINREMKIIDYIASIGQLEQLEAVAIEFLVPPLRYERLPSE